MIITRTHALESEALSQYKATWVGTETFQVCIVKWIEYSFVHELTEFDLRDKGFVPG